MTTGYFKGTLLPDQYIFLLNFAFIFLLFFLFSAFWCEKHPTRNRGQNIQHPTPIIKFCVNKFVVETVGILLTNKYMSGFIHNTLLILTKIAESYLCYQMGNILRINKWFRPANSVQSRLMRLLRNYTRTSFYPWYPRCIVDDDLVIVGDHPSISWHSQFHHNRLWQSFL